MSWDPVLKLYLLNFVLAGPMDSIRDPLKKSNRINIQFSATSKFTLSTRFDTAASASIYVLAFSFFLFFLRTCTVGPVQEEKNIFFCFSNGSRALFTGPTNTLFRKKKNFKTGSYSTIHTFKNYFVIMFLVFIFHFLVK